MSQSDSDKPMPELKFISAAFSGVSPPNDQDAVSEQFKQYEYETESKSIRQSNSDASSSSLDDSSKLADSFDSEAQRAFCDPAKPDKKPNHSDSCYKTPLDSSNKSSMLNSSNSSSMAIDSNSISITDSKSSA